MQLAGDHGGQVDDVVIGDIAADVMNQYLDSRMPAIFGGSNEIQRNILAKQILALPSGRAPDTRPSLHQRQQETQK